MFTDLKRLNQKNLKLSAWTLEHISTLLTKITRKFQYSHIPLSFSLDICCFHCHLKEKHF